MANTVGYRSSLYWAINYWATNYFATHPAEFAEIVEALIIRAEIRVLEPMAGIGIYAPDVESLVSVALARIMAASGGLGFRAMPPDTDGELRTPGISFGVSGPSLSPGTLSPTAGIPADMLSVADGLKKPSGTVSAKNPGISVEVIS